MFLVSIYLSISYLFIQKEGKKGTRLSSEMIIVKCGQNSEKTILQYLVVYRPSVLQSIDIIQYKMMMDATQETLTSNI